MSYVLQHSADPTDITVYVRCTRCQAFKCRHKPAKAARRIARDNKLATRYVFSCERTIQESVDHNS